MLAYSPDDIDEIYHAIEWFNINLKTRKNVLNNILPKRGYDGVLLGTFNNQASVALFLMGISS